MIIELGPELESTIVSLAQNQAKTPEEFVLELLKGCVPVNNKPRLSQEEFSRLLRQVGTNCRVN